MLLPQVVANSLIAGATYALLALGFTLLFNVTKFFNLTYGVLAAIGGYAVFLLIGKVPASLAISAGILVGALVSFLSEKLVFLPLRKRKSTNLVLLLASLGLMTVLESVLAMVFSSQFKTLRQEAARVIDIGGVAITDTQLVIFLTLILLSLGLFLLFRFTAFGKSIKAVADDLEVAKIIGLRTDKIIGFVFLIAGGIAGLVGILVGFDTGIEPTMGLAILLKAVIAAIIGGLNLPGAVLGAFLLGFTENFGVLAVSGEWKDALAFILLILFLIFRPQGIIKK